MLGVCVAPRRAVRAPRLLALRSASLRAAPRDQPQARGRFPEGGGEYGCPGEGSIPSLSPRQLSACPSRGQGAGVSARTRLLGKTRVNPRQTGQGSFMGHRGFTARRFPKSE